MSALLRAHESGSDLVQSACVDLSSCRSSRRQSTGATKPASVSSAGEVDSA
jgi:hypothetical protein